MTNKPNWCIEYYSSAYYSDVHWFSRKWKGRVDYDAVVYRAWTRNGIGRKINRAVRNGSQNDD